MTISIKINRMKNNKIVTIIIIVLAILGLWYIFSKNKTKETVLEVPNEVVDVSSNMPIIESDTQENIVENQAQNTPVPSTSTMKEFTVSGTNYAFSPTVLNVNKGDTVKITFKDVNGFHDFKIDEFNVATKKLNTSNEQTVIFVVDKAGSFEYYCSVGSHRAMGMKGTLIVK